MKPDSERKKRYNVPLHRSRKYLKVHLSKKLKEKNKIRKRSMLLKKGDSVRVMKGKHKGKEVKVAKVKYKKIKVYLEGLSKRTARGREMPMAFHPSNLEITALSERKKKKG